MVRKLKATIVKAKQASTHVDVTQKIIHMKMRAKAKIKKLWENTVVAILK